MGLELRPAYPIRTERLALRPFADSDLDAVLDLESRPDVARFLPWDVMDADAAAAFVARRLTQGAIDATSSAMVLAAVVPPDDRLIAEFMLKVTDEASLQGEIGWTVHPEAQGRGYATEGARELLRLGFDDLGLHRIVAEADARNVGSLRVMEKLGMRREADLRENEYLKGEWVDSTIYGMLQAEWRAAGEAGTRRDTRGRDTRGRVRRRRPADGGSRR
jgi:RimJ/RimL family protein N-acetyltransferase